MKQNKKIVNTIKYMYFYIAAILVVLSGCGKSDSNMPGTVEEELLNTVSEDVVPSEAYIYTIVDFNVPEDMVGDSNNTERLAYYYSNIQGDLSYIAYLRNEKSSDVDYSVMTQQDFKESFLEILGVTADISLFQIEKKNGYLKYDICMNYSVAGAMYDAESVIIVTDDYVFTLMFCADLNACDLQYFDDCLGSLTLVSAYDSIVDAENVTDKQ